MTTIEWKEPPPNKTPGDGVRWRRPVVSELQQRAGTWALVERTVRQQSRSGLWKRMGCEATSRTVHTPDGPRFDIYARWPEVQS